MKKKVLMAMAVLLVLLVALANAEAGDRYSRGYYPTLEARRMAGERNGYNYSSTRYPTLEAWGRAGEDYHHRDHKYYGPITVVYGHGYSSGYYVEPQSQAGEPVGAYTVGGTLLGLAAGILTKHPAGIIGGIALGFLAGSIADATAEAQAAQQPVQATHWYEDSSGKREWSKEGSQTTVSPPPPWVGRPTDP